MLPVSRLQRLRGDRLSGQAGHPRGSCGNGFLQEDDTRTGDRTEIREKAISEGMVTLLQDGIKKAMKGLTDVDQLRRISVK
jgi:hypothetical protein